jgi:hypothetical protein
LFAKLSEMREVLSDLGGATADDIGEFLRGCNGHTLCFEVVQSPEVDRQAADNNIGYLIAQAFFS